MSVPKFSCGQNPTLWAACTGAGSPVLWWGAETLLQGQKDEGSHRLCEFSFPWRKTQREPKCNTSSKQWNGGTDPCWVAGQCGDEPQGRMRRMQRPHKTANYRITANLTCFYPRRWSPQKWWWWLFFIYLFILPHNIAFPNAEAEKQDRYSWTSRAGRNTKVIKIWLVLGEGSWNAFIKVVCRLPTRVIVQCPVYRSLADLIT